MTRATFVRMFDFIDLIPHYFLGANADLHHWRFNFGSTTIIREEGTNFPWKKHPLSLRSQQMIRSVAACVVNWPMTCLRLVSRCRGKLTGVAMRILESWRAYTDEENRYPCGNGRAA